MVKISSFDVFDTCLVRAFAFPSDLFLELGLRQQHILEPTLGSDFAETFRAMRIAAEGRALQHCGREEITLAEIWQMLAGMLPGLDASVGSALELDLERRSLRPNVQMLQRLKAARDARAKIIFVSDTYLPRSFLEQILKEHGFVCEGDAFYVSSELNLTKRSGSLFKHLLAVEKVEPWQITHTGDHSQSDVAMPKSLGIQTSQVSETALQFPEQSLFTQYPPNASAASRLAGGMRLFRLNTATQSEAFAADFVSAFLGPFLLAFASWVLAQARRDGVRRLYFLSRDGCLLSHVATRLAHQFGNIECRYLQVSRQALYLPATTELSAAGMPWIRKFYEQPVLGRLLAKLELDLNSAGPNLQRLAGQQGAERVLATDGDWADFWSAIQSEPLASQLQSLIAQRRNAATAYFNEQGLAGDVPWAVVDLGWMLTCQAALNSLLGLSARPIQASGYYLGLQHGRVAPAVAGKSCALFYTPPPDRAPQVTSPSVFHRCALLEHIVGCAPHGTVHHYELDGSKPRVVASDIPSAQKQLSEQFERLSISFCENNAGLAPALGDTATARHAIETLTGACFATPRLEWIQLLSPLRSSEDQNNIGSSPLAIPYSAKEVLARFLPFRFRASLLQDAPARIWDEAGERISSKNVRRALNARRDLLKAFRSLCDP